MKKLLLKCFLLMSSGFVFSQTNVEQWSRFDVSFKYKHNGHPIADVNISAVFSHADTAILVNGFYDGDGLYRIRFMPNTQGKWRYKTISNIKTLNNQQGEFECISPSGTNHGPVQVSNTFHFKYADGKNYFPVGTTAYAWNHMGSDLQQQTLQAFRQSGFNKVRMCVFPKNYDLVTEEPEVYPFVKSAESKSGSQWDFSFFNALYFKALEKQIDSLNTLGIEADLILFHPYDKGRWGFDAMTNQTNLNYLRYIIARLGSFRNIWWSVANEWDLVKTKNIDEWKQFTRLIGKEDPYHHLLSIHGSTAKYFDYAMPEITHLSIQDEAPVLHPGTGAILRNVYHKPVICDEVGYEGNLKQRWGRYSAEEMTRLMWNGITAGIYVTHGETYAYRDKTDTIFWAKGGSFKGKSWLRADFLRKIIESAPGPVEPADVSRDMHTSTAGNGFYLIYFGKELKEEWVFDLPVKNGHFESPKSGDSYKVDIIDTWEMTVSTHPEIFELGDANDYRFSDKTFKKIRLPQRPYILLRIRQIKN